MALPGHHHPIQRIFFWIFVWIFSAQCHNHGSAQLSPSHTTNIFWNIFLSSATTMPMSSHQNRTQRIFFWIFFWALPQPWLCVVITTLSNKYFFEYFFEQCHNHGSAQPSPPYPKNIFLNIFLSSATTLALPSHHDPIQRIFVWILFWAVPKPWLCPAITTLSKEYFFEYFVEQYHNHCFAQPSPSHPTNICLNIFLSSATTMVVCSHHNPIKQIFFWIFFWEVPQTWLCPAITIPSKEYFFEYHHPIQQIFFGIFFWAVPQPRLCPAITTFCGFCGSSNIFGWNS